MVGEKGRGFVKLFSAAMTGFVRRIAVALALFLGACGAGPEPLKAPPEGALRVATYNVHYIILSKPTGSWSVEDWERRKGPLQSAFEAIDADVIAFQEMESFSRGSDGGINLTLDWLRGNNPDYGVAAAGDWREFPSTQPILYRKARLEAVDQGWFFFSETPETIYSRTFDGSYPAFSSWARFRERESGEEFTVFNIHFDYSSGSNQRKSAELVAERAAPRVAAGERVFVIGDINASQESTPAKTIAKAGLTFAPVEGATWHWNMGLHLNGPVDHLAWSEGIAMIGGPVVLRQKFDGEWPTDHYPVLGDFRLE